MEGVGLIGMILIGILAGWIAEKIMKRNHGLLTNLVVGVVGAFIGGFLLNQLGVGDGGLVWALIGAVVGAVILLFIVGLIKRPRRV